MKRQTLVPLYIMLICALSMPATAADARQAENPSTFPAQANADLAPDFTVGASFRSNLPLVVLEFGDSPTNDAPAPARLTIYDSPDGDNSPRNEPQTAVDVLLRKNPDLPDTEKASYRVTLAAAPASNAAGTVILAGLPGDSEWYLHGAVRDKGMLRNGLAYAIGRAISPESTPLTRYCELLVREGERYRYEGIHIMAQSPDSSIGETVDDAGDFILLGYQPGLERRGRDVARAGHRDFAILHPPRPGIEVRREIGMDVARLESVLNSIRPAAFLEYESLLNQRSAIDLFILNALLINADDEPVPFRLLKQPDGRLRFLPEWEFALALDNRPQRDQPLPFEDAPDRVEPPSILARRMPVWRALESGGDIRDLRLYPIYQTMGGEQFLWFDRLFLSRSFLTDLYFRYHELRRSRLAPERIQRVLDDMVVALGPALERDWSRWRDVYTAATGPFALEPFVDAEGRRHIRQTWSPDQEVVKIGHCVKEQDAFLMQQMEQLDWMTVDLYDKRSSGTRQAIYAFAMLAGMLTLMHFLSRRL